ncbi:MAG: SLC13 family permease [Promethearchaeota archaeon]
MDPSLLLQIIIGICFIGIIVVLFLENQDYLTYSVLFVLIIGLSTLWLRGFSEEEAKNIALAIDWEVIIFLICLFSIVEILNEKKVFHQVAIGIINKYAHHPRRLFYALCLTTTMIATVIEDLSVAIIFIPIVIQACRGIKISPVPYMFGVTICINLASTLTPFGSAENVIIANHFNLSLQWHLVHLGVYFVVTLAITLFLLDRFLLTRYLKEFYKENKEIILEAENQSFLHKNNENGDDFTMIVPVDRKEFRKNVIGLILFTIILMTVSKIMVAGILGLSLFVFLNPVKNHSGHKIPSVSHYLKRIDAKIIYFFALLFITVYFMELAGITIWIDILIERWAQHNLFRISIGILILTSLLSGLLDDAPITIMFLPIIGNLLSNFNYPGNPLFIAFTLGINLGGNFLPQGAACDMMTLELAKKNRVKGFTYRSLTIVGGLFAFLHILLGIGYIYLYMAIVGL